MSWVGNQLESLNDEFAKYLEEEIEITNYTATDIETGPEEWDDPNEKQETSNSPITTTGQVDQPQLSGQGDAWDRDVRVDVVIYIPTSVTVSEGDSDELPYPSTVRHVPTDEVYRITGVFDEGNGRYQCTAVNASDNSSEDTSE